MKGWCDYLDTPFGQNVEIDNHSQAIVPLKTFSLESPVKMHIFLNATFKSPTPDPLDLPGSRYRKFTG
jgi:hypothetical protein